MGGPKIYKFGLESTPLAKDSKGFEAKVQKYNDRVTYIFYASVFTIFSRASITLLK